MEDPSECGKLKGVEKEKKRGKDRREEGTVRGGVSEARNLKEESGRRRKDEDEETERRETRGRGEGERKRWERKLVQETEQEGWERWRRGSRKRRKKINGKRWEEIDQRNKKEAWYTKNLREREKWGRGREY